jgi:serine/threonine-protein kinase HipA
MSIQLVEVRLWGSTIGYIGYPDQSNIAQFEYAQPFINGQFELSPVVMPNRIKSHRFADISLRTFKGLPGVFADSLPDKFGNQLIDLYMAQKGISPSAITAIDRLLYVGDRGMGALEYHPTANFGQDEQVNLALDPVLLAELASKVASGKDDLHESLLKSENLEQAIKLIRVGSSAGGARAKALVARSANGDFFDGTVIHDGDFSYWLMKFDTDENADRDSKDPKGMTKVEYIYSEIARKAGINIPKTDFIENGSDFHFLIERFDRALIRGKLTKQHYASWCGLAHFHRDTVGAYSYEQLIMTMRTMKLRQADITEVFRRAVFNVVGKNQDDHTKNFGFIAGKDGAWSLSPAFDMTYSFDPKGAWTRQHQIKLNLKQDNFKRDDLLKFGEYCNLSKSRAESIIDNVLSAFEVFTEMAKQYEVPEKLTKTILHFQRTAL